MIVGLAIDECGSSVLTPTEFSSIFMDPCSCFVGDKVGKFKDGDPRTVVEFVSLSVAGLDAVHDECCEFSRWWTRYGSGFGSRYTGVIPFVGGFMGDLTMLPNGFGNKNDEWESVNKIC